MNLITETYKVGQIPQELIPDNVRFYLLTKSSFRDTDNTLDEYIVSLGELEELRDENQVYHIKAKFQEIIDQMNGLELSYIHVTKV